MQRHQKEVYNLRAKQTKTGTYQQCRVLMQRTFFGLNLSKLTEKISKTLPASSTVHSLGPVPPAAVQVLTGRIGCSSRIPVPA